MSWARVLAILWLWRAFVESVVEWTNQCWFGFLQRARRGKLFNVLILQFFPSRTSTLLLTWTKFLTVQPSCVPDLWFAHVRTKFFLRGEFYCKCVLHRIRFSISGDQQFLVWEKIKQDLTGVWISNFKRHLQWAFKHCILFSQALHLEKGKHRLSLQLCDRMFPTHGGSMELESALNINGLKSSVVFVSMGSYKE